MSEYIDKEKLRQAMFQEAFAKDSDLQRWDSGCWIRYKLFENVLEKTEAADVMTRDEGIRLGAELAAMHGSDATSQDLEKAYWRGFEDAMQKRDVQPVKHGKWKLLGEPPWYVRECSECGGKWHHWHEYELPRYCNNCGALMVDEDDV